MNRLIICQRLWVAIIAFVAGASFVRAQNWIQWSSAQGGNNHYYALTTMATNWDAAQDLAISWGGTLATITSSNEQNFINTTFLVGKFEHLPLWIGLRNSAPKGSFSINLGPVHVQFGEDSRIGPFDWVTGEPPSWGNWKPGEPSGDGPPGDDCVAINWDYSRNSGVKGDWNDTPVAGTSGYGGATDGPYFGLVERETDPSLPVQTRVNWNPWKLVVKALIIGFAFFCLVHWRKRRRST